MRTPWLASAIRTVTCLAVGVLVVTASHVVLCGQTPAQGVVVSVGILPFHDESGAAVPALGTGVAQLVRQRLSAQHRDTLPKPLKAPGADVAAGPATIEQVQALGKQYGTKWVVQGGVLPIEAGASGTLTVSLYADVVSIDSGQSQTLRADGSVNTTTPGIGIADPGATDVTSAAFAQTPVGQALNDAAGRLAEMIYQSLTGTAASAVASPPAQAPPQAPPDMTASGQAPPPLSPQESDADTQQLVADSQNAIQAYGGAAPQLAEQLRAGLEQLNSALAQKADQMSRGQDTQAADQAIVQIKESMRASLNALVQAQMNAQASGTPGQSTAPTEGVMSRVNGFASEMLSLVQKIQGLRALLGGASQEAAAAGQLQGAGGYPPGTTTPAGQVVEQAPGGVGGVVLQDAQPVGAVEVTETSTGTTTTTSPDGSYTLQPLPPGLLASIAVRRQGTVVATGQAPVVSGSISVADFQLQGAGTAPRLRLLGSTAMSRVMSRNAGTLSGRVLNAQGNPVARVLVSVPGAGTVRTNSRGEFLLSGVAAGSYLMNVREPGQGVVTSQVKVVAGAAPTVSTVRLAAVVALPSGPPRLLVADRNGALVHGRIRDQKDRDLPGVRVSLLRGQATLSVFTDRGGRFALRDVSPGVYGVVVARPGFETATRKVSLKAKDEEKIDLTLKQVTTLVDSLRQAEVSRRAAALPAGRAPAVSKPEDAKARTEPLRVMPGLPPLARVAKGQVRGRVVDARTGRPIGGATVSLTGANAVTDSYGAFHFENVTPGASDITVSRAGYVQQRRRIGVDAGKTATADFSLAAAQLRREGIVRQPRKQ